MKIELVPKKKRWRKVLTVIMAIVILHMCMTLGAIMVGHFNLVPNPYENLNLRVFSNVEELEEKLAPYIVAPAEDPYLATLQYAEGLCSLVRYDDVEYRVAGYVFGDLETATDYFRYHVFNFTRIDQDECDPVAFLDGTIWNDVHYAMQYEKCVLVIRAENGNHKKFYAFENWLTESFPLYYFDYHEPFDE